MTVVALHFVCKSLGGSVITAAAGDARLSQGHQRPESTHVLSQPRGSNARSLHLYAAGSDHYRSAACAVKLAPPAAPRERGGPLVERANMPGSISGRSTNSQGSSLHLSSHGCVPSCTGKESAAEFNVAWRPRGHSHSHQFHKAASSETAHERIELLLIVHVCVLQ